MKPIQTMRNSAAAGRLRRGWACCQKNPFPIQVLFTLFYRLMLDVLYITMISPLYVGAGFALAIYPLAYISSWLALLVAVPFVVEILNRGHSASSILVSGLNYIFFIPMTAYCGCKGADTGFFICALLYWGILLFLQMKIPAMQLRRLPAKRVHQFLRLLTVFSILFVLYVSGKYTGFRLTLDFINVYDVRLEARTYSMPAIISYILSSMTVILTVLLLYWMSVKKYLIVAALCLVYLFYFSISAQKTVFFLLLIAVACVFLYREWMVRWLPGLLSLAAGAAMLETRITGTIYLLTLLFRRVMMLPVLIAEQRWYFFRENPLGLFQDGIMGKLSYDNIYSSKLALVIGEYRGKMGESANNGLIGDMVSNLPVPLGLLIMPMILIICFRMLDMTTGNLNRKIFVPFCIFFAFMFLNGTWSTVLLSHGFLLACALLYLFPKEGNIRS